jgi:uncharacterized protein (DUF1501 family)
MHLLKPELHSRRAFLKRTGQLAFSGAALPMAMNLAALSEAAAFSNPSDYKALVCVFLYGANDFANTVVTYDNPSYAQYLAIRGAYTASGGLALPQADLAATLLTPTAVPADSLGVSRQFSLNPAMTRMATLFNAGKVAVQLNVGPLVIPLTRDQYNSSNTQLYPRPPQLFSHNDQQSIWQSSAPEGSRIGWGGNMGDLALPFNTPSTFTCISVTGNAVFLSGDQAVSYQVTTNGAVKISSAAAAASTYGSTAVTTAMRSLIQQTSNHALENEYNKVSARSIAAEGAVSIALTNTSVATSGSTSTVTFPGSATAVFPTGNSLADQLKLVARLISARSSLGAKRQVFMVSLGGFDTHDYLARDHGGFRDANNAIIPGLVGKVSEAIGAFYDATAAMGIENNVTTFTASDFGRTLASNGDGSDHGWGSHHFVVGGAVKGQKFYGTAPPVSTSDAKDSSGAYLAENQWHVGQGRLLPTTSVDQYGATMAKWFGVAESEMTQIFPNIGNFPTAGGSGVSNTTGIITTNYAGGYMGFMGP